MKKALILIIVGAIFFAIWSDQTYRPASVDETVVSGAELACTTSRNLTPPKKFHSDGCSMFPQNIGSHSWEQCCIAHDVTYWCGGDKSKRKEADTRLAQCANDVIPGIGTTIYAGVRLGGSSYFPTPWRFGYGWPYLK